MSRIRSIGFRNQEVVNNDSKSIGLYRMLLLVTAFAYPCFGLVNTYLLTPAIETRDILIQRFLLGVFFLVIGVCSIFIKQVADRLYVLICFCTYIGMTHLYYIGYSNYFVPDHIFGMLFTFFGTALVYRKKKQLLIYLVYNVITLFLFVYLSGEKEISGHTIFSVFIVSGVVLYITISSRIDKEQELVESNNSINLLLEHEQIFTEQLLDKSMELEQTQETAQLGTCRVRFDSSVVKCTPEFISLFQLDPSVLNQQFDAIISKVHIDDRQGLIDVIGVCRRAYFNKTVDRENQLSKKHLFEYRIVMADQSHRHIISNLKTISSDAYGEVLVTAQDITDLRKAQKRAVENERKYHDIVMLAREGIWEIDSTGKTLFANKKMCEMLEYTDEEMLATNFFDFMDPGILKKSASYGKVNVEESIIATDFLFYSKSGKPVWGIVSHALNLVNNASITSSVVIVTDITERKEKEVLLIEKEMALRSAKLRDNFITTISHELRTPLNAISLNVQLLLTQKRGPLNESQQRFVGSIQKSEKQLVNIIDTILDLSKIRQGSLELQFELISLDQLMAVCVEELKEDASHKKIEVIVNLDRTQPTLYADERKMKQIIINLLSNAIKFSYDGSQVGISTHYQGLKERMAISVWDHGIGISSKNQATLFAPFTQVDSGLERNYQGAGLGLSLVKSLVELQGGTIELESKEGEGTTVTVFIPLRINKKN